MKPTDVTKDNFEEIITHNDIVILDFWASWCGPCRIFEPIFEKVAGNHPEVFFGKVNADLQQELAAAFQIRSIPTLMAFREKVLLFSQPGLVPEPTLEDLIFRVKNIDIQKIKREIENETAKEAAQ